MIRVEELSYTYPGQDSPVLKGLNFNIRKGEIFGFLGPSGAGKSTTQNILIGKLKEYNGSATVLDQEVKSVGPEYFERVGVAFEFPNFYNRFTALENLRHFGSLYRAHCSDPMDLLQQVGLKDAAHMKVGDYSKGMKMRLNYCRAVQNNPDVLFLDEPTSGLDPVNADMLKKLIKQRKDAGTTVILTTHNMQAAELLCDRVAFIVNGVIKLIDSPKNLMLRNGERKLRIEYQVQGAKTTAEFPLTAIGDNPDFLSIIRSHPIVTMHSLEATLDQIFMDVTGESLV
ncbi:ABC transporter ATP-binding protein [Paenibacillus sp. FSL R7-0337]|uniref:ABC transporter ATP-binding protein n=1 Tax=Paenibacillus sp. FSL R7-0337 TaxID=1926588 RepID=UPI00096ECD2C|nr:ABC transporter ATP-binding protein [Paenibacillus sp. FSL R7-0337]OMG00876.1 ABC transporter ATP-binding protein [Paenibacillus sp. FSL R7-0337]